MVGVAAPDLVDFRINETVVVRQRNADVFLLYDTAVPRPLTVFGKT